MKDRTWGIAAVIGEERTRGHILNSTVVAWLLFNSVKKMQYYSRHLWCKGPDTNMWFRRQQRGPSEEADFWHLHKSNEFLATTELIRRMRAWSTAQRDHSHGSAEHRHRDLPLRSKREPLRQLSFGTSADQLRFLNVFNITITFVIEKSSMWDL